MEPNLSDEVSSVLDGTPQFQFDNEEDSRIAAKLLTGPWAQQVIATAEANKAKELNKVVEELKLGNKKMIDDELERIRKAMEPPNAEDLAKLINQEYAEMPIKIMAKGVVREFTLRELPMRSERKFLDVLRTKLVPQLKALSSIEFKVGADGDKISAFLDALPTGLDVLAGLAAVALDPFGTEEIDADWVQGNISAARITAIVRAQLEVGRLRDFFLAVSQLIPRSLTV